MIAVLRFLEHQFRRVRSTWTATVVNAFAMPTFFLLTIGFGLGTQVDDASIPAPDFASFVGPGVLAAGAILQGGGLSLWPTLAAVKWEGTYRAVLSTPLTTTGLAVGHVIFIGLRSVVTGTLFTIVLFLFGIPTSALVLFAPLATGLISMSVAAGISAYSATRETDGVFSLIMRLGLTPMFLFSGALFPLEQLPKGIEWAAKLLPGWHGVELVRGLTLDTLSFASAGGHLVVLFAYVIAGTLACNITFSRVLAR